MKWGAIVALLVLSLVPAGCGGFDDQEGDRLVKSVGPDRLRAAAASVRSRVAVPATDSECRDVPQNLWPEALRDLDPRGVCITNDGLMVTKYAFFVAGEGLLILFDGAEPPKEGGADPAFRRLSDRIYWFQFTG